MTFLALPSRSSVVVVVMRELHLKYVYWDCA